MAGIYHSSCMGIERYIVDASDKEELTSWSVREKKWSCPAYTVGYLVAFCAVEVAFVLFSLLRYLLITCIAFHKPKLCEFIEDKLSPMTKWHFHEHSGFSINIGGWPDNKEILPNACIRTDIPPVRTTGNLYHGRKASHGPEGGLEEW
ncbi:MAG: hypothetical protein LUO93_07325 [Methanomicrobiales archaeon]|nr:hypothetical protein [Methanomicrobiales archaeon]